MRLGLFVLFCFSSISTPAYSRDSFELYASDDNSFGWAFDGEGIFYGLMEPISQYNPSTKENRNLPRIPESWNPSGRIWDLEVFEHSLYVIGGDRKTQIFALSGDGWRNIQVGQGIQLQSFSTCGDSLWIGTSSGLYRMRNGIASLAYTQDQGLPSNIVRKVSCLSGTVILGTVEQENPRGGDIFGLGLTSISRDGKIHNNKLGDVAISDGYHLRLPNKGLLVLAAYPGKAGKSIAVLWKAWDREKFELDPETMKLGVSLDGTHWHLEQFIGRYKETTPNFEDKMLGFVEYTSHADRAESHSALLEDYFAYLWEHGLHERYAKQLLGGRPEMLSHGAYGLGAYRSEEARDLLIKAMENQSFRGRAVLLGLSRQPGKRVDDILVDILKNKIHFDYDKARSMAASALRMRLGNQDVIPLFESFLADPEFPAESRSAVDESLRGAMSYLNSQSQKKK